MKDLRDPKELGDLLTHPGLKAQVQRHYATMNISFRYVYDYAEKNGLLEEIEDYAHDESTVQSTMAQYKAEMTEQAAQGDTAARIVCAEHGWAYGQACITSNGRERWADEEAPDVVVRVQQCRKPYVHPAHTYADVPQPGVRAPVEMLRCPGRV